MDTALNTSDGEIERQQEESADSSDDLFEMLITSGEEEEFIAPHRGRS